MQHSEARQIAARYIPNEEIDNFLAEHTQTRVVSGREAVLYDPYAAALSYVLSPDYVTSRTEGSVSETYIDPELVVNYLRAQSEKLRLSWGSSWLTSVELDVRGWR